SIFQVRWGYKFALVLIIGILAISAVLYAAKWYWMKDYGMIAPTSYYADQVRSQIRHDLFITWSEDVSVIFRWRNTGVWDEEVTFPSAALFWFTYDTQNSQFTINRLNQERELSPELLSQLQQAIVAQIDSIEQIKGKGFRSTNIVLDDRSYHLNAKLYEDEPRFVGLVMDMDHFRDVDLPRVFSHAYQNYPMLRLFAMDPEINQDPHGPDYVSNIFVLAKDADGEVIAKIGYPGKFIDPGQYDKMTFHLDGPYMKMFGFSLHYVIPQSIEKIWRWYMSRGFFLLIAVWMGTMILWVWAELKRIKISKSTNLEGY
ncbi:MAG: hypothetical protein ABIE92_04230, partial [bacterium]